MVKTAKSRAHARRILGNWIQSCKDTKDPLSPLIGGKRPSFTLGEIGGKRPSFTLGEIGGKRV